jgi:hypothetical protein
MKHTPTPLKPGDGNDGAAPLGSVANPRRIRLGDDGRPTRAAANTKGRGEHERVTTTTG